MAVEEFIESVGRRSEKTADAYQRGLDLFALCHHVDSPDLLVTRIKAGKLNQYQLLDKFISFMSREGYAPKSIWGYVSSVKSYYRYEEVDLDDRKFKKTVRLPVKTEISLDRIPTRQEVRDLLINTNARGRALVALLCTSGVRIGEASNLRIGNVDLDRLTVTILGTRSKSKKTRITFISKETAQFIREYLGKRIDRKEEWLFPNEDDLSQPLGRNALASAIHRLLEKRGLLKKLDPESYTYQLHVHCFRKYFFTNLIQSGVERGVAEFLVGHKFGLDANYLRMMEEKLRVEYDKAIDHFTFLSEATAERLEDQLKKKDALLTSTNERLAKLEGQFETIMKTKITT
ncbi:MAG: site-specific integrase [Candidatus Bathyarchaeia archaeon]